MRLDLFDYELPPERIAQHPLAERDASRMLVVERASGALDDRGVRELPALLEAGDVLVANDSRVLPARLLGRREPGGGDVEALLLEPAASAAGAEVASEATADWRALVRPGRKLGVGARLVFAPDFAAEVIAGGERGERTLRLRAAGGIAAAIERHGHMPLPPYIHRADEAADRERYQTVYARAAGSAAAPTAGLHFTPELLARLGERGIGWATVRLHVGLGTFQPVEVEEIEDHPMHAERYELPAEAAAALNRARDGGGRIVAIGTTAARVLETAAPAPGEPFAAQAGETRLFLYPGRRLRAVDALLTNFHAPRTTLLMMIAAFAGLDLTRRAYAHALAAGYRFLSYGDCMLIR
jgi:S-adenosylmethionine:tRNA ribosyltransferase-isomerase